MTAPGPAWSAEEEEATIVGGGWRKRRRDCNSAQAHPRRSAQSGSLTQDQVGPFAARAEGKGKIVVTCATGGRHKRMTSFEEWRERTPAPK
jgi:hypothetical protein